MKLFHNENKEIKMVNDCKVCLENKVKELLEKLAIEKEKEIINEIPEKEKMAQDEYQKQVDGFKFECVKWGDMLNIYVEKFGNEVLERSYTGAINLKNVKTIKLIEGHLPDKNGEVHYDYKIDKKDNQYNYGSRDIKKPLKEDEYWSVYSVVGFFKESLGIFYPCIKTENKTEFFGQALFYQENNSSYIIKHKTNGYPRYQEEDMIQFTDIGNFHVPAGFGKKVYEKILKATDIKEINK